MTNSNKYLTLLKGDFGDIRSFNKDFVEEEEYEKGFAQIYNSKIKPLVNKFEKLRILSLSSAIGRCRISSFFMVIILIAFGFYFKYCSNNFSGKDFKEYIEYGLLSVIVALGSFALWVNEPIKKYEDSIKSDIFTQAIKFFENYNYSPECDGEAEDVEKFKDSLIFPKHTRIIIEDKITGQHQGISVEMMESCIFHQGPLDEEECLAFRGVIVSFSMHKKFNAKTIIRSKNNSLLSKKVEIPSELQEVNLEDVNFEKKFDVYSQDQIEARYLLTTSFMIRLYELISSFEADKFECSFYNNKLLMMITFQNNLFEPSSIFERIDFTKDVKKFLKEMWLIFGIIEELKLNQNIGL